MDIMTSSFAPSMRADGESSDLQMRPPIGGSVTTSTWMIS